MDGPQTRNLILQAQQEGERTRLTLKQIMSFTIIHLKASCYKYILGLKKSGNRFHQTIKREYHK